jgi:hypothetical protein
MGANDLPDYAGFFIEVHRFLREEIGGIDGEELYQLGQSLPNEESRFDFYQRLVDDILAGKQNQPMLRLEYLGKYKWEPVDLETFVCDPYYLNKSAEIYPKVLAELKEMNSGKYQEIVLTGGIGCAKTTCALYSTAYQLYILSCMYNPHAAFGLDPSSEILIIFQSINKAISTASYKRFKSMVEDCQYFKEKFYFDKNVDSRLIFPHRIEVVPISGQETAAIGQNVIGGMIDELNYMSIVEKSRQSVDQGTYDQAVALYNSIARRRKTRFLDNGAMPGLLCLVSSKRYPGQFTDLKTIEAEDELRATGRTSIYIYDYRVWEVKPPGTFTKGVFKVFAGDLTRKPRILQASETVADDDQKLVVEVPLDFKQDFETDIINALREIAGISTLARHPYFVDVEKVTAMFNRQASIFSQESVDFIATKLQILPKRFYKPQLPRFVHIDLGLTGDSAGVVIGTCTGFKSMKELGFGTSDMMMPEIYIDGLLEVKPPKGGEILFWKIREVLTKLRELGLNVRWVTFDSWQSKDSQQLLRQSGFVTGEQSIDTTTHPYDFLKSAIYTGRVQAPPHFKCQHELISLEKDTKTAKIDHPPTGSKDCSDALAGVVYGLTMRREIWGMYAIPAVRIPDSIQFKEDKAA